MPAKPNKTCLQMPEKLKERLYPVVLDLFSSQDFHRVNIREISRQSGISSGTIYKYFPSKEQLIFGILDEKISWISRTVAVHIAGMDSIREIFRKVFWVTFDFYDQNPGLAVTAFITVPMRTWMKDKSYCRKDDLSLLKNHIKRARERGDIDPALTFSQIMDAYYMICHRYIHNWYFEGMTWKLTEKFDGFFTLFWKMIRPIANA
ncbi:MAG: TetR/AcrR family transcriptional regulator [Proteobacteria bacterium]|nr:TetR/AcrR family transcriptional regulator [Desulfobacula sp.]MBU4130721.1 TetR/AcrR family transcriptional regulator [Pseudomonadota bacterium]